MDNKSVRPVYCLLAGSLSLLLFSSISQAASIDTGKIQPKVANVPAPVSAPPPVKVMPPAEIRLTTTHTASPPPQAPKAVVNTPTYNVRPDPQVKLPPQTVRPNTNVKHPPQTVQPRVNVQTPTQKVQTLDPRYAPKLAPAPSAPRPGQNLRAPAATPRLPTTNALGGSKVDRQTLDRIQNIQEAATAAQVFKQLEELKKAQDLQKFGAAKQGLPGEETGAIRDAGGHLGIGGRADASSPGTPRPDPSNPEGFLRTGNADPAAGSGSAAPTRGLDTSRQGWVSTGTTTTTTTNTVGGHTGSTSITQDEDGNVVGYSTEGNSRTSDGGTTTTTTKQAPGSGEVIVTTTETDSGGDTVYSSSTRFRALKGGGYKYDTIHSDRNVTNESSTGTVGSLPGGVVIIQPNENYDNKKYNDCVQGAGGCTKKTKTKPKDMITQPSKGDADADPGSSPIIGAAAVTNEDEFHSGGGGGGGGGVNKDMLTQPPTEGAEGGGSTPPPPTPSGASLDEALGLGDAALH